WGDQSGCLLADYVLERAPGGVLVTPVSSTQAAEAIAKKRNARVFRTRVGSVDVSRTIIERNATFGFEENGGCIYPPHISVRDGAMTTPRLLECFAARGLSFSRVVSYWIPRFTQPKARVKADPGRADRAWTK